MHLCMYMYGVLSVFVWYNVVRKVVLSYYRYVQSQSKFGQDACVQGYDTTIVMRLIYCTNNTRHTSGALSRVLWACQVERVVASGVDNVTTMDQVNLK